MTAPYDPSNVFARILRGELPAHRVLDEPRVLAIMDIMPRADGHALVLPRAPARNLLDADPADLAAAIEAAQRVARAAMRAFGADGVTVQQFNEAAGGQVVFHLHLHVIPRVDGVGLRPHTGTMAPAGELERGAAALRAALAAG